MTVVLTTGGLDGALGEARTGEATPSSDDSVLARRLAETVGVTRFELLDLELPDGSIPVRLETTIQLGETAVEVALARRSVRGPHFRFRLQESDGSYRDLAPPAVRTYVGKVRGETESAVTATLFDEGLSARIERRGGSGWTVRPARLFDPASPRRRHVLYRAVDETAPSCGCGASTAFTLEAERAEDREDVHTVDETASAETSEEAGPDVPPQGAAAGLACTLEAADLAYDTDYEFFDRVCDGDPDRCLAIIEDGLNTTNVIYVRDVGVIHRLGTVLLKSDPASDFYAQWPDASDFGAMLSAFRAEWNANHSEIDRDVAYLLTAKSRPEYGGLAYVGTVCTSSHYGMGIGDVGYAGIMRHELGHSWSAGHDCGTERRYIMCGNSISAISGYNAQKMRSFRDSRGCLETVAFDPPVEPPYARPDRVLATVGGGAVSVPVLDTDTDSDCSRLRLTAFDRRSAAGGEIHVLDGLPPDGLEALLYIPRSGFVGSDYFSYAVGDDSGLESTSGVWVDVLPRALVGYYPLDETTGEEAADLSGFDHEGELDGDLSFEAASVPGRFGRAVRLTGDSDQSVRIEAHPFFDLRRRLTVSAWFRVDGFGAEGGEDLVRKGGDAWRINRDGTSNRLKFTCSGVAGGEVRGRTPVADGEWHHAVGVFDGGRIAFYLDGELEAERPAAGKINRNTSSLRFGNDGWNGAIDEVRIYNYGLTDEEIARLYRGGLVDNPAPADGTTAGSSVTLSWIRAAGANAYDVYLGTDRGSVANADMNAPEYQRRVSGSALRVVVEPGETHFWRLDPLIGGMPLAGPVRTFTSSFAFTEFDEPALNARSYSPGPGDRELGFQTTSTASGGANPYVGVIETSSTPTTPIFSHRSVHATTIFQEVDLSDRGAAFASLILQVRSTGYEDEDLLDIYLRNGEARVDLVGPATGVNLSQFSGTGYARVGAEIPPAWEAAQLVITSRSNSSQGSERYDFDGVSFGCQAAFPYIAGTRFEEAVAGADSYTPSPGARELGFATTSRASGGVGPLAAVQSLDTGSEGKALTHRSVVAMTTFESVDLRTWGEALVFVVVRVHPTGYESDDRLEVYVTDGAERIDVLDDQGDLSALGDDEYLSYSAAIPASWSQATLVFASSSNSSVGAERFDLRSVSFTGAAPTEGCGEEPPAAPSFRRGDANGDGLFDLSDGVSILNFLFLGGSIVDCRDVADTDDSGELDLSDGIRVFNFLFLGGAPMAAPGPQDCGPDPTADSLICEGVEGCA